MSLWNSLSRFDPWPFSMLPIDLRPHRVQKLELLAKDPHCHWCGKEVKDYGDLTGKQYPHDLATLDHLVSRFFRKKGDVVKKVLACWKCNEERSLKEQLERNKQNENYIPRR